MIASLLKNLDSPPGHFAVGMVCAMVLWLPVVAFRPRWWLYTPLVMTLGGLWAEGPDLPLLFKYYPSLIGGTPRGEGLSNTLHGKWADVFFFHGTIDRSGDGGMLKGWALTIGLYAAWSAVLIGYALLLRRRMAAE